MTMAKPIPNQSSKKADPETLSEKEYVHKFMNQTGMDLPEADEEQEDLSVYEEERTTAFPPYWKPLLGRGFVARVVDFDGRNPEFLRYVLEAAKPVECQMGKADDENLVTVQPGELFTTSVYRALPLHEYMGLQDPIIVVCVGTIEVKNRPNEMWKFSIRTSPRNHAMLEERRALQKEGEGKLVSDKIKRAFELAHTAKDPKAAIAAHFNTKDA
jgi:hypothetical protein